MIIDWNTDKIVNDIQRMSFKCSDPYMDGFVTWPIKQDLYRIKWAVERALEQQATYVDEDEFIKAHEKEVMWHTLKK